MTFRATFAAGLIACALMPAPASADFFDDILDGARDVKNYVKKQIIPDSTPVQKIVTQEATAAGVPVRIAHAIIRKESGYNCRAKNPGSSAAGAGQLVRGTARAMGVRNVFDCRDNIRGSMRYLRQALNRGGAGCAGVSLYQSGVGARPHCSAYGRSVMQMAARVS